MISINPAAIEAWAIDFGIKLIYALIAVFVSYFIIKIIDKLLGKLFDKTQWDEALERFLHNLAKGILWIIVLLIVLTIFNVSIGPMVASLGIAGFVLGFALKDTLGNLAAGVMIMLYRPFTVGHYIEAAGQSGSVKEVGISAIMLVTPDNKNIIIPNSSVWGSPITNYSANPTRRLDIEVGIAYTDDIGKAIKIGTKEIEKDKRCLTDPEPLVAVKELGDSSVSILMRFWVKTSEYWPTKFDFTRNIKEAFDKNNLSIPFPQSDIHIVEDVAHAKPTSFGKSTSKKMSDKMYADAD